LGRCAGHAADTRAWREQPVETLEIKRPEIVSYSFFAHRRAFSYYSTRYNVSITLVFTRSDLFGYPSLGSRDLSLLKISELMASQFSFFPYIRAYL
jgi:hypothetical protein